MQNQDSHSISKTGIDAPVECSWESLGISQPTIALLNQLGLLKPTPIQAASIPVALQGRDLIASAQTGTGKTASFVLPLVERLKGRQGTLGLVLAPTREIAQQIQAVFEQLGAPQGVRSIVLIGGVDMKLDEVALGTYPQVIVATPGRLCDHLDRGNLWIDFMEWVVLDEADRMLDLGFSAQLSRIMNDIPDSAHTLVYSATISASVQKLTRGILVQPQFVSVAPTHSTSSLVNQKLVWMLEESKSRELRRLIDSETGSMIVFVRSKDEASRLFRSLHSRGYMQVTVIHSDLRQMDREQFLADFKSGKFTVLITTDIAGRGIHVDGVAHVVNFDLPREPEDYVHRIGRTGRANATGRATSFATLRDRPSVREIEKLIKMQIPAEFIDGIELRPVSPRHSHGQGRPHPHHKKPSRGSHSHKKSRS